MVDNDGWLQDIENIKEPEQDPNVARSSVFGYLEARNMKNWCSFHNDIDNNLSMFQNDDNISNRIGTKFEEDARNFRRHLKLEHRKRNSIESEFRYRSAVILKRNEVSIDHRESVRHVAKTAHKLINNDIQMAIKLLKLELQEIDNFLNILEPIVDFWNTSSNRTNVQVKAAIITRFQIGNTLRATQVYTAAVKTLVQLEKRAGIALHPESTLPSIGESSANDETEGSRDDKKSE